MDGLRGFPSELGPPGAQSDPFARPAWQGAGICPHTALGLQGSTLAEDAQMWPVAPVSMSLFQWEGLGGLGAPLSLTPQVRGTWHPKALR